MHLLTIIWTLFCASLIMGYPLYLLHKSSKFIEIANEQSFLVKSNMVELISFDLSHHLPGWSIKLDVPQITEEVLYNNLLLFYLESSDSCLKLPLSNGTLGYTASVYKNVGKVYVTFKSLVDGVSNFYAPSCHISKLKILIVKPILDVSEGQTIPKTAKADMYKSLQKAKVNINQYEEVIEYLSNIAMIEYKGYSTRALSGENQNLDTFAQSNKTAALSPTT
ncbi:hypothetical protein [Flagellimonas sp. 2504JD4-2]